MEYVSGGSLTYCLGHQGRLNGDVVKSFTGQILAGLEYLHSKGLWHWNLTIDNVLLDPQGRCKISDHGLSKHYAQVNTFSDEDIKRLREGLDWLAPEIASSPIQCSAKADIWSVGYIWQYMHTGLQPSKAPDSPLDAPPALPEGTTLRNEEADFRLACFTANPELRPSVKDLRAHKYLSLPDGWEFVGLGG